MVRSGRAWLGRVRQAGRVMAMLGAVRCGSVRYVLAGQARRGSAELGQLWYDMAVLGKARCGRRGKVRRGAAR